MTTLQTLLLTTVLGADPLGAGDHTRTLTVGDLKRSYLVHIPPWYDPKIPTPVVLAFQAWVNANGCEKEPVVTQLPDAAKDGTSITRKTYGAGKDGAEVVLIEIEGAGHTWPGQQPRVQFLGKSTKNISANDLMWEFFQKHPMK